MARHNDVTVSGDVKIQKPIYFLLSQLTRIDQACEEENKTRADFVRNGIELYLDLRDATKMQLSDAEVLDIVKKHMKELNI